MYEADSTLIIGRMYEDVIIIMLLMKYIGKSLIKNIKKELHLLLETSMIMMLIIIMVVSLTSISLTFLSIDSQLLKRYVLKTVEIKSNVLTLMWRGRLLSVMKLIVSNWYNLHLLSTILMTNLDTFEPLSVESTIEPDIDKVPPLRWHHHTLLPSMATKFLHIKRALRWLVSKKRKAPRRVERLVAGISAHKRWEDEWDIIKEAGRISFEHRSVDEQIHRTLLRSSLIMIESLDSNCIATAMLQIIDILTMTKSPSRFPFSLAKTDDNLAKKKKSQRNGVECFAKQS